MGGPPEATTVPFRPAEAVMSLATLSCDHANLSVAIDWQEHEFPYMNLERS